MCTQIPQAVHEWFTVNFSQIPGSDLRCTWKQEAQNRYLLTIQGSLQEDTFVGQWHVGIRPNFEPSFYYTPHLTPKEDNVIDMHVYRTPAMMMGCEDRILCVMPVLDDFRDGKLRHYMDFIAPEKEMRLGLTTTRIGAHVLYHSTAEAVLPKGEFVFGIRFLLLTGEDVANPFRPVLSYYWENYGRKDSARLTDCSRLMPYVKYTYDWAMDRWENVVWQEFELDGKRVGAPQMIVVATQSPNFREPTSNREQVAIWNQAWFSSLRSAQGLFRYGKETGNEAYVAKARMTKELALAFPQEDGLFDTVIGVPNEAYEIDGKTYYRSSDWETHKFFGNSNRNPVTRKLEDSPRHVLDMSWTALKMLEWYEELEQDQRLINYARKYADRLLTLQDTKGYFPAWIDKKDGHILQELKQSPECAVSVSLLVKLYQFTGEKAYLDSALRCMDVLIKEVMPDSRWEDFETYWSCSRYGADTMQGKKFTRNSSYKQCSLSPFWMAQALYDCYMQTGQNVYLQKGQRCLDEMLMYQSSFQPNYFPITVVGGFGVMNCDAELNDARQSLFAETILCYGKLLKSAEYMERGSAALRASFSMMYCPENPAAKIQWEKRWPFFGPEDYGFMMENYGHDGYVYGDNLGIGVFTIYDWGNGAASEAVMRIKNHFYEMF